MEQLLKFEDSFFAKDNIILLEVENSEYLETLESLLFYLVNAKKMPCVYLTVNRPYSVLRKAFEARKIDLSIMIFVEAVPGSKSSDFVPSNSNCLSLDGPNCLTDISLAITEAIKSIPHKEKFVIIDSLDAFLRYETGFTISRFMHFLLGKIRESKAKCIVLTNGKKESKEVAMDLSELCQYEQVSNFLKVRKWL